MEEAIITEELAYGCAGIGTGAMGAAGMVGCIGTWGCTGTGTMAGCGGAGATCALPMVPPRLWPQLVQNWVPSGFLAPHSVQKTIALRQLICATQ